VVTNCSRDWGGMALRKAGNHGHPIIIIKATVLIFLITSWRNEIISVFGHAGSEAVTGTAHHYSRDASRHVMSWPTHRWLSLLSGLIVTPHDVMSVYITMLMNMHQVNHTLSQPQAIRRALQDLMRLGRESDVYLLATKRRRGGGQWWQFLVWPLLPSHCRCRQLLLHLITLSDTHTHTQSRTPLDEWSARRRDLCLTTRNIHQRQTSMLPTGFEPALPASERPQTRALDRAAIVRSSKLLSVSSIVFRQTVLVLCSGNRKKSQGRRRDSSLSACYYIPFQHPQS